MDLRHVRSVVDRGTHYEVDHATHGTIKVPKNGLSKSTRAKIQAFADGGIATDQGQTWTPEQLAAATGDRAAYVKSGGTGSDSVPQYVVGGRDSNIAYAPPGQVKIDPKQATTAPEEQNAWAKRFGKLASGDFWANYFGDKVDHKLGINTKPDDADPKPEDKKPEDKTGPVAPTTPAFEPSTPITLAPMAPIQLITPQTLTGGPEQLYAQAPRRMADGGEVDTPYTTAPGGIYAYPDPVAEFKQRQIQESQRLLQNQYQPSDLRLSPTAAQNATPPMGMGDVKGFDFENTPPPNPGMGDVKQTDSLAGTYDPAQQPTQEGQQAPTAPPTTPAPQTPGLPSAKGIFGALDQQSAAVNRAADVAAREEAAKANVWEQYNQANKVRDTAFQNSMMEQDKQYDKLRKDIQSTKINPNRMWQNASAVGKVGQLLGIALSGLGAGMAHQSNLALDNINKMIDRDIDAQKANLDSKNNLLRANLLKSGDMRQAEQMTRTQMLAGVQGQLNLFTAKYGGDRAKAQADLLNGQLNERKEVLKYKIASDHALQAQQQVHDKMLSESLARVSMGVGNPNDEVLLGEKGYGERMVETPTGRGLAHSKEAAEKFREEASTYGSVRDIVRTLQSNAKELSMGTLDSKRRGALEAQTKALALELPSAVAGIKRLNENEYKTAVDLAPNPAEVFQLHSNAIGKLDALGNMLDNRFRVMSNQYLVRPAVRRIPGR
jgi:hypothetical protein